jgi:3-deoxy-D-manno-octulosonic-acid transferase
MIEPLYRGLTSVAAPALTLWLAARERQGKEDAARIAERRGIAGQKRPAGWLVWLQAASVGESMSVLPLVARLRAQWPDTTLLFTSGTVTSAKLLAERLPPGCLHQFMPLDVPAWIGRFLDHWRPDAALWVESELWPNAIAALRARGIPAALVNARMSPRSFSRWRAASALIRPPLDAFDPCLAQDETTAARLKTLGASRVQCLGNLKFDAEKLPIDDAALARLSTAINGRKLWLAASIHPGEVEAVAAAHRALAARHLGLLTIVVPRHPERGGDIAGGLAGDGFSVAQRSAGALPSAANEIYVADTLGELGLFYRLAKVVFIGGSLVPHGGQNAMEAARLGAAIIFGPHMENFTEMAAALLEGGGAAQINDAAGLVQELDLLLADPARATSHGAAAQRVADAGRGTVERVAVALAPLFQTEQRRASA